LSRLLAVETDADQTAVFAADEGAFLLLSFFLEEIGPIVENKAVADVLARLQSRVMEIDT